MSEQEQFEKLKQEVLQNFENYMDTIRKTSFDDLCDIHTRLQLIDIYTKSTRSEIAYRTYLNKFKMPQNNFLNKRAL